LRENYFLTDPFFLGAFVTYMDVGNADLVWNTDRPHFARVFRSAPEARR
jgi:hypothetical protein